MIIGRVLKLYIAPINTSGIRKEQETICLYSSGIKKDKFANKDLQKSVMIIGQKPYAMAKENNITLPQAALGENILLNFDPHELEIGSELKIGEAIIKITQACTLCKHLTKYSPKLPKLIIKHRGIYCQVIKNGIIKVNDKVELLNSKVA